VRVFKAAMSGFALLTIVALMMGIMPLLLSMFKYPAKSGYFVVVHWHTWRLLFMSAMAFSIGFIFQYRRVR